MAPGGNDAPAWQVREHLHLALQPDAHAARPCRRCEAPCPCSGSSECACACSPGCHHAADRLVTGVPKVPKEWLPLAWELAELRVAEVTAAPASLGAGLSFRSPSLALVQLLSEHMAQLEAGGALQGGWRLEVRADPAGPCIRIAPHGKAATDAAALTKEVRTLSHDLARTLRTRARQAAETFSGVAQLTPRERVVLLGLLDGLSVRTLARHLFVSRHTVRNQMRSIYEKLGVHSHDALLEVFSGRTSPHEVRLGRTRRPSQPPGRRGVSRAPGSTHRTTTTSNRSAPRG